MNQEDHKTNNNQTGKHDENQQEMNTCMTIRSAASV
jgi:hypothetical protein